MQLLILIEFLVWYSWKELLVWLEGNTYFLRFYFSSLIWKFMCQLLVAWVIMSQIILMWYGFSCSN